MVMSVSEWGDLALRSIMKTDDVSEDEEPIILLDLPGWSTDEFDEWIQKGQQPHGDQLTRLRTPSECRFLAPKIMSEISRRGHNLAMLVDRRLAARQEVFRAISKMDENADKAMECLWDQKILKKDAQSMAKFILNTELPHDRKGLGTWIGNGSTLANDTLSELLTRLCFNDVEIDTALRRFLQLFRLPGEAQKIDRIMEAFAAAYCRDNPNHPCFGKNVPRGTPVPHVLADDTMIRVDPPPLGFTEDSSDGSYSSTTSSSMEPQLAAASPVSVPEDVEQSEPDEVQIRHSRTSSQDLSADMDQNTPVEDLAYIVVFSTILLHTDAHSREIKQENKMTKEQFVRNNRRCRGGHLIPVPFLEQLYDRVLMEEWRLEEDDNPIITQQKSDAVVDIPPTTSGSFVGALGFTSSSKRRQFLFMQDSQWITRSFESSFSNSGRQWNPLPPEKDRFKDSEARERVAIVPAFIRALCRSWRQAFHGFFDLWSAEYKTDSLQCALDGLLTLTLMCSKWCLNNEKDELLGTMALETGLVRRKGILGLKQAAALERLLKFASIDPDSAGHAWSVILVCLSELDRLSAVHAKSFTIRASLAASMGQITTQQPPPPLASFAGLLPPRWDGVPFIATLLKWWTCQQPQSHIMRIGGDTPVASPPQTPPFKSAYSKRASSTPATDPQRAQPDVTPVKSLLTEAPRDSYKITDEASDDTWKQQDDSRTPSSAELARIWSEEIKSAESLWTHLGRIDFETLYSLTEKLSFTSICCFFECYVQVSVAELRTAWRRPCGKPARTLSSHGPTFRRTDTAMLEGAMERFVRTTSLQRLLDLTESAMTTRPTSEASDLMTRTVLPHLTQVALHPDMSIAEYACDVLKQMSMSVLDSHRELDQTLCLRTLPAIFAAAPESTREFLVNITYNIIKTRGHLISAGWEPVLDLLSDQIPTALTVRAYDLSTQGHTAQERLLVSFRALETCMDMFAAPLLNHFPRLVRALSRYVLLSAPFAPPHASPFAEELRVDDLSGQALGILCALARVVVGDHLPGPDSEPAQRPRAMSGHMQSGGLSETTMTRCLTNPESGQLSYPRGLQALEVLTTEAPAGQPISVFAEFQKIIKAPTSLREKREAFRHCPCRKEYLDRFVYPLVFSLAKTIDASAVNTEARWKGVDVLFSLLTSAGVGLFLAEDWSDVFNNLLIPLTTSLSRHINRVSMNPDTRLVEIDFLLKSGNFSPPTLLPDAESTDVRENLVSVEIATKTAQLTFDSLAKLFVAVTMVNSSSELFYGITYVMGHYLSSSLDTIGRLGQQMFISLMKTAATHLNSTQWTILKDFLMVSKNAI